MRGNISSSTKTKGRSYITDMFCSERFVLKDLYSYETSTKAFILNWDFTSVMYRMTQFDGLLCVCVCVFLYLLCTAFY